MEKSGIRAWGLVIAVVALMAANVWIVNKSFLAEAKNKLPQINLLGASSFVIQNAFDTQENNLKEALNVLVLGKSGGDYIAPNLTDTIFVAHVDPAYNKVKIISVPRDLAVKIPNDTVAVKINSLYQIGLAKSEAEGLSLITQKAEEVTGLKIDRFVMFDLATVEKVIDEIGGVNVQVKNSIYDTRFPTNDRGYEIFSLPGGIRFLNGKDALRFIRTRHSAGGDFDRIDHQQEVLKALKGKIISLNPVWDFSKLWSIFNLVKNEVKTNLNLTEIQSLWQISKNLDFDKIETLSLNAQNGLVKPEQVTWQGQTADILVAKPEPFGYSSIKSAVSDFINSDLK